MAEKRLTAIRDFAEFGSGFKIAMRDLEIRGAGNLLGAEQSGHMMSVGYDMYLKLLDEAVREEQGMKPAEPEVQRIQHHRQHRQGLCGAGRGADGPVPAYGSHPNPGRCR